MPATPPSTVPEAVPEADHDYDDYDDDYDDQEPGGYDYASTYGRGRVRSDDDRYRGRYVQADGDDGDDGDDDDDLRDDDRTDGGDGGVVWRAAPSSGAQQAGVAGAPTSPAAATAEPAPRPPTSGKRVRVVLAERKAAARPVRTVVDLQGDSPVGEALRTGLIVEQMRVALRFALLGGLTLGVLPLLFDIVPELGTLSILGLRVPWLVLGFLVYPFLFGLGWWFTRTAERVEQDFADHIQDN